MIVAVAVALVSAAAVLLFVHPFGASGEALPRTGAETASVEMPELLHTLVGERDFSAPADAVSATGDEAALLEGDVPAVEGLARVGESADSITLSWYEISGVSGYRIYYTDLNAEGGEYKLFSTVKRAGLEIRNLSAGSLYGFRVAAFAADAQGEAAEITCATIPTEVEGFQKTAQTKDTTAIAWERNARADGYLLERCYKGEWSDYQTFDTDVTEFTDEDLTAGKAYYYRISAFREDSGGRLYGDTDTVRTVAGLLGPKDDGSASKLGRVSLDYKKSDYADGYDIFYSTDREEWEELGTTEKTHYGTSRLVDGETYYFRIYPYREVDEYTILGDYTELEFVAKKEIYGETVGDTYVEVSVSDQHMWYVVDGDVYLESDCVTGNYNSADTPKGFWYVNNKISPCTLKGDDYVSYVTYWMPFIGGGWGLHDATWRSKFGGNIYKGNGSHGCVNLPYDIAKKMYAHIEIGTPVIVY